MSSSSSRVIVIGAFVTALMGADWAIDFPTENEQFVAPADVGPEGDGPNSTTATLRRRNEADDTTLSHHTINTSATGAWSGLFSSVATAIYKIDVVDNGSRVAGPVTINVTQTGGGG